MLIDSEPHGRPDPLPPGAPEVIVARDISVRFATRRPLFGRAIAGVQAVDGVSITVRAGETVGLVGESGSGKSTMGLAMLRLERAEGRVAFLGQDLTSLTPQALRHRRGQMQIVFQDP